MVPGTGVVLNNFLNWTDLSPDSPNALRAGERIAMCSCAIYFDAQRERRTGAGNTRQLRNFANSGPSLGWSHRFWLDVQAAIEMPRARSGTDTATWNAVKPHSGLRNSLHAVTM